VKLAVSGQLLAAIAPLAEIARRLAALEVAAIELWPENIPALAPPSEPGRYEGRDLAGAAAVLAAHGIAVAGVALGGGPIRRCATAGPAHGTAALVGAVDAAVALGAPVVGCYLAALPPETFVAAARPAAAYAERAGVSILLENEAHDDSGLAAGVRAIVDAVASPAFGTQFDPCNFYQANEEAFPAAYEQVKDAVRSVHLKGGCRHDPERRPDDHPGGRFRAGSGAFAYTMLAEGAVNVDGLLRRLVADGYGGFVTVEPHVPPERVLDSCREDVAYVRGCLQRLGMREQPPVARPAKGGSG